MVCQHIRHRTAHIKAMGAVYLFARAPERPVLLCRISAKLRPLGKGGVLDAESDWVPWEPVGRCIRRSYVSARRQRVAPTNNQISLTKEDAFRISYRPEPLLRYYDICQAVGFGCPWHPHPGHCTAARKLRLLSIELETHERAYQHININTTHGAKSAVTTQKT